MVYRYFSRMILGLCLVACLILADPVSAHAAETVASGSAGESINWVLTDDGTLTLSGYGEMEFNGYRADAEKDFEFYQYRSRIKSIVIEEGITTISNFAFYNYGSYITSVSLPESLISIGDGAFYNALKAVTSIRLPSQLQSIGSSAFRGMGNLVSITIPASVVSIGARAFAECSKLVSVVFLSDSPPAVSNSIFESYKVLSRIMVPDGSVSAYQQAEYMAEYAGFITDGLPDPNVFTVLTSWADQHIYIDSGEIVHLYFVADGVNGSVSVDWYVNGVLFNSFNVDYWLDNDTVIDAYWFDPGSDGYRTVYAVVHNTIGSNTQSVTTPSCTIVVGQGTGSGSTDSDRFDQIDVELTEVKDAIGDVSDKVDGLSDQLDELQSGGSAGEDLSDRSDQLADDFAGIDEFEQSQMDILDSGMVQIKDSVSYTSFIPALAFVQRYADMTFDSIFDISIIFYLPMFLGLFFFLCSRVPYNIKDVGPKEKKNSIGFRYDK